MAFLRKSDYEWAARRKVGEPVRVEMVDHIPTVDTKAMTCGDASWDGVSYVIRVAEDAGEHYNYIFCHELAHLMLGHVKKVRACDPDAPFESALIFCAKTGLLGASAQKKHDDEEQETEELTRQLCQEFGCYYPTDKT